MACPEDPGNYDFFNNIENYIKKEKEIQTADQLPQPLVDCKSFSQSTHKSYNSEIVKGICEDFTKLYKSVANFKGDSTMISSNNNDWGFLNYWLNYKLKENKINENICIKTFYDSMEPHFSNNYNSPLSIKKIYDIQYDDYNNMKALYFLYEKYIKLHNILSPTTQQEYTGALDSSNDCFVDYIKAKAPCIDKHSSYCEKLNNFKSTYEKLFSIQGSKKQEFNNNFKQLPEDSKVSELLSTILFDENFHSIVTIPLILSIFGLILLIFLFYKFTPFGQMLCSKKRKLTKKHIQNCNKIPNISLMDCENKHKNLYHNTYNIEYHAARNL
ncbi:hypothetical protein PVC01_000082500 [Plasmodium vivax]|uniref:VIR protein n=1 Tax=Plasmodium vivax TaxID=5855 RepID=A0A1G4E2Y9_PLAVI|nr:hypothetical protein PVC01_000082500 [Plasmodium vivax]